MYSSYRVLRISFVDAQLVCNQFLFGPVLFFPCPWKCHYVVDTKLLIVPFSMEAPIEFSSILCFTLVLMFIVNVYSLCPWPFEAGDFNVYSALP